MNYKNISVAGSGVLGSQIIMQCASHGYKVSVLSRSEESTEKTKQKMQEIAEAYRKDLHSSETQIQQTFANISFYTDLADCVKDADLVIEAVPENVEIKTEFYKELGKVAPEKTVFATNSSTLVPSMFADFTGRPEKFLALHFANKIWTNNTAEAMGHSGTEKKYFDEVVEFAKSIGMLVLPLAKEQPGYILNTLLVPFLSAGMYLWANDIADPLTIDKTWMKATGAPMGPFAILDMVGLITAYNVSKMEADTTQDPIKLKILEKLKELIDAGKLGVPTKEGFYTYPNPAFEQKDFLSIEK